MAVYTEVSDEELRRFLEGFDLGAAISCKGIAEGVENSTYLLMLPGGPMILTLYEKRTDPADLPYFLGLIGHLAERGIRCPSPVPARDGAVLHSLCGRPAVLYTFLEGVWPRRIEVGHCAKLGAALAGLHVAQDGFAMRRANGLGPREWPRLVEACAPHADGVAPGLRAELEDALARILREWPAGLPKGHIHADLFPDNVFFLGGEVSGLIDFTFACHDLLAYDLAVCLNSWCFEPDGSCNVTKARALLAGYQGGRMLSREEAAALPVLCAGSALRFLLTRLYDWVHTPPGALVKRKDPLEYLKKLRFHLLADGPGAYGLG